jgi:hypothetical protein
MFERAKPDKSGHWKTQTCEEEQRKLLSLLKQGQFDLSVGSFRTI